jgi:hypothetical protein
LKSRLIAVLGLPVPIGPGIDPKSGVFQRMTFEGFKEPTGLGFYNMENCTSVIRPVIFTWQFTVLLLVVLM